jgi:hypothetical protein
MDEELRLLVERLMSIVVGEQKHQDYERVTQLANDYYAYITGVGLDDMMKKFNMRETDEAFEQRKLITQHVIPSVVGNITSVERKVPRSNGKTRILAYKGTDDIKKAKDLEEILNVYWGTESLDDWMATRWIELNDVDPNTFVVVEWKKEGGQNIPYPYESKSHNAVMFEFVNNVLQFLVDLQNFPTRDWEEKDTSGERYTMYLKNQTIQAIQIFPEGALRNAISEDGVLFEVDGLFYFRRNNKVYFELVFIKPHNLGFVPAFPAGYKRDEQTDGRTYVSPYNDCVPYLQKTLKANSELDLTMCLHAFPQKLVTAKKCTGKKCMEGVVMDGEKETRCGICKGTGFAVHTSAQDIVYVPLPRGKEEQLSLDNLVRYVTPETALLEFQRDYIEYLTNECMQAVFNSDIFTAEEVATTATEKRIDLDNIYDTLYPLSLQFSWAWEFQVDTIAIVTGKQKNLIARLTFSKDFKFKSKDDYIRDRNAAKEAGTPDAILRQIDDEIMKIDTAENPIEFDVYKTVQSFDPFSGKTEDEIMVALSSNTVPFDIKVLYNNLGWIFDDILTNEPEFFTMNRKKQQKLVKEKVDKIVAELEKQQTQAATFEPEDNG